MFLEFPSDRTTHYLDRQYMLGPNLLVAPVFVPEGEESEYYIPAGRWTSFFHPERAVDGPVWISEVVPIDEIPVWVRPGSVLCLGPKGIGRPDYDLAKDIEVQAYELVEGQVVDVDIPIGKGREIGGAIKVEKEDGKVSVNAIGDVSPASLSVFADGKVTKEDLL